MEDGTLLTENDKIAKAFIQEHVSDTLEST